MSMPFRKKILLFISMLAIISGTGITAAEGKPLKHHRHRARHHAALVDRSAGYSDIVIDAETGQVLHATNAEQPRHPASLTKMMTLYLTFQALQSGRLQINQYLPVSEYAAMQSPSKLCLPQGQRIRVEDAILGVVTESANDAAVVLAEWLGGGDEEDFARMMTRQAHALGMAHTHFNNASGLPNPGQVTTARDMALLARALIYHFPQFYPYFSHDSFAYAGIYHHNHNHLMDRYEGMDGIKTGYIRASGFNLVASARHGDTRLIGVIFGGRSAATRDNRMAQLLDQSFAQCQQDSSSGLREVRMDMPPVVAEGDAADEDEQAADQYVPVIKARVNTAAPAHSAIASGRYAEKGNVISGNNYGIQIGAYSDPEIGRQALARVAASLPQLLGSADPVVQKFSAGSVTMFRARLMLLDQKTAQMACTYLMQQGQNCLTVGP